MSFYANGVCSSFLNGSKLNSSAEHGYEISNFSSTVGCRMPSTPISRSSGRFSAALSVRFSTVSPDASFGGR